MGEDERSEPSELETIASRTAYDSFYPAAMAIEPGFIEACGADVVLAYHAVVRGVENVVGAGSVIVGRLPNVNLVELSQLPRLAQGLVFAELRVEYELQASSFGRLFDEAQGLRRKLRKTADALAEAGLLSDADAEEVWLRAQQDILEDCVALTALLRRNEGRLAGRSPLSGANLTEAEQLVGKLRLMLGRRSEEGDDTGPSLLRAIEQRDRFWTLLAQRHDVLWRCGAWLHGRGVEEKVPPLPRRQSGPRRPVRGRIEIPVVVHDPGAPEPRRPAAPPAPVVAPVRALVPASPRPAPVPVAQPSRHLADLERKARFLLRIGVTSSRR
ncbi:hypothetical protein [Melittangium boletus]|uniref:hypothetical protein n=1 Tax=Melittangium boletus TaxID=83453 RepID=UPI003DA2F8D5